MTNDEIYIFDFIIEIYCTIAEYERIYGSKPHSIAVDTNHYNRIKTSPFGVWVHTDTMTTMCGVQIVQEDRYKGTFMSARSEKYKQRKE